MIWLETIFTFFIGLMGARIAKRLKIPSAYMIGAMVAVAIFSIFTGSATYPTFMKNFTQTISGIFIGAGIRKEDILLLKKMVVPAVANVGILITYSLSMAVFLYHVTDFSFATAAFATAPGGIVDMTIVSMDLGADTGIVSVLQTIRLFTIIAFFPSIFSVLLDNKHESDLSEVEPLTVEQKRGSVWKTAAVGIFGAFIGSSIGIPAGPLIGSMLLVGLQNVTTKSAVMPLKVKFVAQISAGTLIGSSITASIFLSLREIFFPAAIMVIGYIILSVVMGFLFFKTNQLSLSTALFACAPGGASDLALMSIDYHANPAIVSLMQTMRVVTVIALYPTIIALVTNFI